MDMFNHVAVCEICGNGYSLVVEPRLDFICRLCLREQNRVINFVRSHGFDCKISFSNLNKIVVMIPYSKQGEDGGIESIECNASIEAAKKVLGY